MQVISANERISNVVLRQEQTLTEYMLVSLVRGNLRSGDEQWYRDLDSVCPGLRQRRIALLEFINITAAELVGEFYEGFLSLPSLKEYALIYRVPVDGAAVFLLGLAKDEALEAIKSDIVKLLSHMSPNGQPGIVCLVSSCKDNCEQAPEAYRELLSLKRSLAVSDGRRVYSYDPSGGVRFCAEQPLSPGLQNDFSQLVRLRRSAEAQQLAQGLLDGMLSGCDSPLALQTAGSAMLLLLGGELSRQTSGGEEEDEIAAQLGGLLRAQSPSELGETVRRCISLLCHEERHAPEPQKHAGTLQMSDICTYIQENFRDPELNVSEIAKRFHMSMPYLSKLFKDVTGYNVLEYIYLTRLNYAKSQLRETSKSVYCIAQESGFKDPKRLTQLIKKYEGTTPGRFRRE